MSDYERIANWIYHDCGSPISEIEWLLKEIKEHWEQQDRDIYTEYDAVFENLKESEVK
jgi:hypothetical protein